MSRPWAALCALCLGFFMLLLDSTIVAVALPAIGTSLGSGLDPLVWTLTAYLLAYTAPMLLSSRLGDRFGPKRVYLTGLVLFVAASAGCGLAGSAALLIAARAVQGLAAALMTPQTFAFISHLFPPARRGPARGVWTGVAALATVAGPVIGGLLVDGAGWRWIFFVNVPVGVLAVGLNVLFVPDWRPGRTTGFDIPGIVLSSAGLAGLVCGLQGGRVFGLAPGLVLGAGVALLVAFVVWQRHNRRQPLVPLGVFADRNFSAGTFMGGALAFAMAGMVLPLVLYFQVTLGLSPTEAGLLNAPSALLAGALGPLVGRLTGRMSGQRFVVGGLLAFAAGLALTAWQLRPGADPWAMQPALLLSGIGIGCVFAPMSTVTMSTLDPRLIPTASGVFSTVRQAGGVLGTAAVGMLLQASGGSMADAVRVSLLLPVAVLLLGALAAAAMRTHRPHAVAAN
ncbi:DHA2 family efflux MFS transporter permease subunit [Kutzneria chonburiensis]|uniref:DHA2 family efflux MFS transporter permease subunit n=1 Tax=Kutzneria chonburiensis TaxID=1483604 RepID=A0ABV6MZE2_9PSEU|nr:DHA2 family efflux MFS transporter permease subunit [Kutzneria chonburiensis]